jgi:hypothetical protein
MENADTAAAAAGLMAGLMVWMVFCLAISVVMIVAGWKIFTKAGKPGWAILVPFYNVIVQLEIVGKPWWWMLLMIIPFVNFILAIILCIELAKVFGKGTGFGLGLVFLGPIFILILAFGSATYVGPGGAPAPAQARAA